ncbi:MAG: tetratricopeptide repeat protein [Candidatus Cloacimonetes bacterium]|nr:tetratricopeptide repeat protein [Candidatus Cloacimonadota bacterium]
MDKNIKALLWEAEHHIKSNWILSVEILEDIIKKAPYTLSAYEILYSIFVRNSLFKKAESTLKRAMIFFPDNDHLFFLMGNIYIAQKGKAWKAIEYYQKVKKRFPELEFNLALALAYQDRKREAIKIFERIIPYFSHLVTSYSFFAEQYISLKEYDKAIDVLKTAEKKFPANKEIYYLIGICYNKKKNWIQAYLYFEKTRELGYSTAEFYNTFGECCHNMGDLESGIKYLKKSIAQNMFYIKSYLDLSKLYILKKDFSNAKKYLSIARKIDPLNIYIVLASERLRRLFKNMEKL